MNNRLFIAVMLTCTLGLAGCSMLSASSSPAIDVYTLSPIETHEVTAQEQHNAALILGLSPIRSSQDMMGTGIIYRDAHYSYNTYAYSRWNDSPSKLLALYLQHYLPQSPTIIAVMPSGSSASQVDLLLEATLLDFSHHLESGEDNSTGQVSIIFYLIDPTSRAVLASKQFSSEIIAETKNAKGATMALNQASKSVADALRIWLETEIEQLASQ